MLTSCPAAPLPSVLQRCGLASEAGLPERSRPGHRAEEQQLQTGSLDLLRHAGWIRVPEAGVRSAHTHTERAACLLQCGLTAVFCLLCSYVSRYHVKDSARHVILGTQQFKPNEFASQINLSMENAWGILRCVIDICRKLDEGKYLILKDPNKVSRRRRRRQPPSTAVTDGVLS